MAPDPLEACPCCGLTYGEFRTGLAFGDVRRMLWTDSEDSADWKYKRRNTVLGLWMSVKRDMWAAHLAECQWAMDTADEVEDLESDADFIPW